MKLQQKKRRKWPPPLYYNMSPPNIRDDEDLDHEEKEEHQQGPCPLPGQQLSSGFHALAFELFVSDSALLKEHTLSSS